MHRTNLAVALRSLYDELHEAMTSIPIKDGLNFRYDSVEVELAMEMGESSEAGGGAKFFVVEASGKTAAEERVTHTMRINLTPIVSADSPLRLPELTFLSACETAVGNEADASLSATRLFQATGAASVIATGGPSDQIEPAERLDDAPMSAPS